MGGYTNRHEMEATEREEFIINNKKYVVLLTDSRDRHVFRSEDGLLTILYASNKQEFNQAVSALRAQKARVKEWMESPDSMLEVMDRIRDRQKSGSIETLRDVANSQPPKSYIDMVAAKGRKSPKERRTIRGAKTTDGPRRSKKWAIGLATVALVLGLGYAALQDTSPEIKEPTYSQTGELPSKEQEVQEKETSNSSSIDSVEEAEKDLIERYVNAYNKLKGTNYKPEEVIAKFQTPSCVFKTNNMFVTVGSNPKNVADVLNGLGMGPTGTVEDCKFVQFIINETNYPLGGYNEFGTYVQSGLTAQKELKGQAGNLPTVQNLAGYGLPPELLRQGVGIIMGANGRELKESMKLRLDLYNEQIPDDEEVVKAGKDGFEIGD